jgi:heterotetrameric sarcosine oxidase gamma subunit
MVREIRGWHLAQLTSFRPQREEFRRCLTQVFGAEPPTACYRAVTHGGSRLIRLSADQYWWIANEDTDLRRFAAELSPLSGAVTALSAGRVCLRVEGAWARDLLARGIAIDLHPAKFAIGQSAQTGLHHTGIFLERVANDSYELYVPRTFATSIRQWLTDASLPFGVSTT